MVRAWSFKRSLVVVSTALAVSAVNGYGGSESDVQKQLRDSAVLATELVAKLENYTTTDGAVLVKPRGERPARIVPYFANLAALGWTETAQITTDTALRIRCLDRVRRWLTWYTDHLNHDGTIYDFRGETEADLAPTGSYDSTDSYAATWLVVAYRYVVASHDTRWLKANIATIDKIYQAMLATTDEDSLSYNLPLYPDKCGMDNAEVIAGRLAYVRLAKLVGDAQRENKAETLRRKHIQAMRKYWWDTDRCFAVNIDAFDVKYGRLGPNAKAYPDAMANLMIFAWLGPLAPHSEELLRRLDERFFGQDDVGELGQWWLLAGRAVGADSSQVARYARETLRLARLDKAWAHVVGMAAAIYATGLDGFLTREQQSSLYWADTATSKTPMVCPAQLLQESVRLTLSGYKAQGGILPRKSWLNVPAHKPMEIDYELQEKGSYLQLNMTSPGRVWDVTPVKTLELVLEFDTPTSQPQVELTLIEEDGDWWDLRLERAPARRVDGEKQQVMLASLASASRNRWSSPDADSQINLNRMAGLRIQLVNDAQTSSQGRLRLLSIKSFENARR